MKGRAKTETSPWALQPDIAETSPQLLGLFKETHRYMAAPHSHERASQAFGLNRIINIFFFEGVSTRLKQSQISFQFKWNAVKVCSVWTYNEVIIKHGGEGWDRIEV